MSFQYMEQRDSSDTITKQGVVGKKSPFANSQNSGIYDVIAENFRALKADVEAIYTSLTTTISNVTGLRSDVDTINANTSPFVVKNGKMCVRYRKEI